MSNASEKSKTVNSPLEDKINAERFAQPHCRLTKSMDHYNTLVYKSETYQELQLISTRVDSNVPNMHRH